MNTPEKSVYTSQSNTASTAVSDIPSEFGVNPARFKGLLGSYMLHTPKGLPCSTNRDGSAAYTIEITIADDSPHTA